MPSIMFPLVVRTYHLCYAAWHTPTARACAAAINQQQNEVRGCQLSQRQSYAYLPTCKVVFIAV